MSAPLVELGEFIMKGGGSVNPAKHPDEVFHLYSIPAYDSGRPDEVEGAEIGSNKNVVQGNDVLLSRIVPHIRRGWIVDAKNGHRQIASGEWIIFRSERFDPGYLRYHLLSDEFNRKLMRTIKGVGGSLMRADPNQVAKFKIPLPPLPTQRRSAAVLDKAQALVANDRRTLAVYDQLAKSLFLEMFGDPVRNERGWPEKPLAEVVMPDKIITYGIVQAGPPQEDGVPYIRTGDIANGKILVDRLLRTTTEIAASYERSRCSAGDIVMSIRATIGTTAIVPDSLDGVNLTQGTARISPDHSVVTTEYLHWAIKSDGIQMKIDREAKGATFREITLTRLRDIPVPVPPLESQCRFSAMIKSYEVQRDLTETSLRRSEGLFGSLLQGAFSGGLG